MAKLLAMWPRAEPAGPPINGSLAERAPQHPVLFQRNRAKADASHQAILVIAEVAWTGAHVTGPTVNSKQGTFLPPKIAAGVAPVQPGGPRAGPFADVQGVAPAEVHAQTKVPQGNCRGAAWEFRKGKWAA
jgi:hypothetical protein